MSSVWWCIIFIVSHVCYESFLCLYLRQILMQETYAGFMFKFRATRSSILLSSYYAGANCDKVLSDLSVFHKYNTKYVCQIC